MSGDIYVVTEKLPSERQFRVRNEADTKDVHGWEATLHEQYDLLPGE